MIDSSPRFFKNEHKDVIMQHTQYLVVTAIGTDRTGIVSDLTRLVNDCSCNILDSRMAIFGKEFTFIMLLSGDRVAIAKVENALPSTSHELGLLTMMKRTTRHIDHTDDLTFGIEYVGPDLPGTLNTVTGFLTEQGVGIASLKTDAFHDEDDDMTKHATCLTVRLSQGADVEQFTGKLNALCDKLNQQVTIHQII